MSFRVKIFLGLLIGVTALAAGFLFFFGKRSTPSVTIPEAPAAIPELSLPTTLLSPQPDAGNRGAGNAPSPASPTTGERARAAAPAVKSDAAAGPEGFSAAQGIIDSRAFPSDEAVRLALASSARLIAERFGTFSSQNEFRNLYDLQPFMTSSLSAWLDGYIREQQKIRSPLPYSATTTLALKAAVKAFEPVSGRATVLVQTSQTAVGAQTSKTVRRDFEVKFAREQDVWKLDNVRWIR